jgi:hypothetical protein
MKNIFRLLAFSIFVSGISSCEKAETKDYYEGGTPPVLSASTSTVTLESGQEANTAIVFNWTNPDYKFTTGLSSHDVTYTLEIDTLGGNFSSSIKASPVVSKELSKAYTVGELNNILGNDMLLQLTPRRNYTFQVRVTSSIASGVKLTSNVITFTTKPFQPPPKVTPPPSGHLYIVGDATPGAWNNPVPEPSQEFTKLSNTLYEITIPLISGGKHYLFLPLNGSWDNKYAVASASQSPDGGDFGYNGGNAAWNSDIPGPLVDGTYKITVNFQLGKYTVVKQ